MSQKTKLDQKLISEALRIMENEYDRHNEFNESFDDEPLQIAGYEHQKSRAIYWLDNDAYFAAKGEWQNREVLEKHEKSLRLLKNNHSTTPFRGLVDAIKRKHIVPFIGAGLSQPMNMPLWGDALRQIYNRIHLDNGAILQEIDAGCFLEAAQLLADHDSVMTNNFIRTTYKVGELKGSVKLLPDISNGCIVTTNFDNAIEEVFKNKNIIFDGYMHGTQGHNFFSRLVRGQRCLMKLHGDGDDQGSYILTQDQYENAYGAPFDFQLSLPKALRQLYISNSLIFLGCSLEQDKTLDIFSQVKNENEYEIPEHYAILPEPIDLGTKQKKESRLIGLNIQPIWYPDSKHEFVERLLSLAIDMAENRLSTSELGV